MTGPEIRRGDSPLVLGLPHTGTDLPAGIAAGLNDRGRALTDTDWHVHDLYDGLVGGLTTVRTPIHRYAIDVNRDPGGDSLYPGQNTTGLCPVTDFDGNAIHADGYAPDADEVARRRDAFHAPYHAALAAELDRVRARHGHAILYDCHSIRSHIPYLFDGTLPVFNIGTDDGATCGAGIARLVHDIATASGQETVLNGRFRGGWTTRHFGRPETGIHAIQMELAQRAYLTCEAPPWTIDADKSARLRAVLADILTALTRWRPR